jgi:hypothetical protein
VHRSLGCVEDGCANPFGGARVAVKVELAYEDGWTVAQTPGTP